jgi:hypothetical protein
MSVVTVIPYQQVPGDILRRLLESFIARDGTDYGEVERSLDDKVNDVRDQLSRGEVHIVFDGESESFTLLTTHEARALGIL